MQKTLRYGLTCVLMQSVWMVGAWAQECQACINESAVCSQQSSAQKRRCTLMMVGRLSRKGPDAFSWWAVQTSQGQLWRLQLKDDQDQAQLYALQYQDVTVCGQRMHDFLSTPVLSLELIERVQTIDKPD